MKKPILILIVVVVIAGLGIGGFFVWKSQQKIPKQQIADQQIPEQQIPEQQIPEQQAAQDIETTDSAQKINENVSQGVLPSVSASPLEDKPDINPVDKTNPFKDIKTNPFE